MEELSVRMFENGEKGIRVKKQDDRIHRRRQIIDLVIRHQLI